MANDMITGRMHKQPHGKVHELLKNHGVDDQGKVNMKREQFLTLLKQRYGYANEGAHDEMKRLLRQFYRMDRSFRLDRIRLNLKHSPLE